MERCIAYSKVTMPDGQEFRREVVVFDANGHPLRHFPLTCELPFVDWYDSEYCWPI